MDPAARDEEGHEQFSQVSVVVNVNTSLNVSLLRPSGGGYAPLGLCFQSEGTSPCDYRMLLWDRPGDGRVGLFVPAGVTGRLPGRVVLSDSSERRLGSGVFVPGMRGMMLRLEALPPENGDGEIWLRGDRDTRKCVAINPSESGCVKRN
ncbi:hypothetical protein [Deinococcus sp. UYEF24]